MPDCSQARKESSDEEVVGIVGVVPAGLRTGAEPEGLTCANSLRRANLMAASDTKTVIDTFRRSTCVYYFVR